MSSIEMSQATADTSYTACIIDTIKLIALFCRIEYSHMQKGLSLIVDPSNDDVRVTHSSSGRQSQSNPSSGAHIHCKPYTLPLNAPVQPIAPCSWSQVSGQRVGGEVNMGCQDSREEKSE